MFEGNFEFCRAYYCVIVSGPSRICFVGVLNVFASHHNMTCYACILILFNTPMCKMYAVSMYVTLL